MAVFTFLEKYDFTGKTILPLCTHEGSGMGGSERDIAKSAKGATLKNGLPINGSSVNSAKPQVEKWLKENGVIE
jgi:flavodoxin